MNNCKHEGVIYTSNILKCWCNNNKFHSNGETCCDKYMVEGDELTCLKCGNIFTVFCDDGICSLYRYSNG